MEKKIECPGENLERLMYLLEETIFENLMKEPLIEDIERIVKQDEPDITGEEIMEIYKQTLRSKVENRRDAEGLFNYGNTRKEIFKNLREHVAYCKNCFNVYMTLFTKKTNEIFRYTEKCDRGSKALKFIDKEYLKLL